MEHPDWPAFVAAIVADPDDDTARLVAADFLEENGDPERAAFIRIQVQLARLESTGQGKTVEADELRKKERAFLGPLSHFPGLWAAEECPELVKMGSRGGGRGPLEAMTVEGAHRLRWRRGFVETVICPVSVWMQHGEAVRKRQPVREVLLLGCDSLSFPTVWTLSPALEGLRRVGLDATYPTFLAALRSRLPNVEIVVDGAV